MAAAVTLLSTAAEAAAWLGARLQRGGALRSDSRAVRPGDAFIAWPGAARDGRQFVHDALAAGAVACLVEAEGSDAFGFAGDGRIAAMAGLKAACGVIASLHHGEPSARLHVIATTGTNGKTSTAWWTAQALSALGRRCGVVGTLGIGEPPAVGSAAGGDPSAASSVVAGGDRLGAGGTAAHAAPAPMPIEATGLTTPDPVTLQAALRRFVDAGFAACAMEASSIGIVEQRLAGVRIEVALFTNFTQDHLDYHGSMADYWAAKRALFDWPGLQAAVLNIDDVQGAALAAELEGTALDVWTVSLHAPARLRAQSLRYVGGGLAFDVVESGGTIATLASTLVGDFNASNLLVVIGALRTLGVPLADAVRVAGGLTAVPGRLQRVVAETGHAGAPAGAEVDVVVDYAHTPDALDKALQALRPLAQARGGRLWCVFGCGGNRDATKRPLMGAIAVAHADRVVITSDNPRDEPPDTILAQILAGAVGHDEVDVIEDRRAAIAHAVADAAPGDVVLLAGKGHEDYQEIAGVKRPFSDIDEARAALVRRAAAAAASGDRA